MNNSAIEIADAIFRRLSPHRRARVLRQFNDLFKDPHIEVRDALIQAINAEVTETEKKEMLYAIEREMLREQETEGIA